MATYTMPLEVNLISAKAISFLGKLRMTKDLTAMGRFFAKIILSLFLAVAVPIITWMRENTFEIIFFITVFFCFSDANI